MLVRTVYREPLESAGVLHKRSNASRRRSIEHLVAPPPVPVELVPNVGNARRHPPPPRGADERALSGKLPLAAYPVVHVMHHHLAERVHGYDRGGEPLEPEARVPPLTKPPGYQSTPYGTFLVQYESIHGSCAGSSGATSRCPAPAWTRSSGIAPPGGRTSPRTGSSARRTAARRATPRASPAAGCSSSRPPPPCDTSRFVHQVLVTNQHRVQVVATRRVQVPMLAAQRLHVARVTLMSFSLTR